MKMSTVEKGIQADFGNVKITQCGDRVLVNAMRENGSASDTMDIPLKDFRLLAKVASTIAEKGEGLLASMEHVASGDKIMPAPSCVRGRIEEMLAAVGFHVRPEDLVLTVNRRKMELARGVSVNGGIVDVTTVSPATLDRKRCPVADFDPCPAKVLFDQTANDEKTRKEISKRLAELEISAGAAKSLSEAREVVKQADELERRMADMSSMPYSNPVKEFVRAAKLSERDGGVAAAILLPVDIDGENPGDWLCGEDRKTRPSTVREARLLTATEDGVVTLRLTMNR